jgi:D-alanyl-D-alanine carboxypeptidase
VPGITAGYARLGGESLGVAAGVSDVESGTRLASTDRMLLGSVGKTFVAALAMQLVSEQLLDLDSPMSHWLGDDCPWIDRVPNGKSLTLRNLLMHRSGIPRHIFTQDFLAAVRANPDRVWAPAELVSYILDAEPKFPADGGFAYADTNYILIGMAIEKVTHSSYYEQLAARILAPLHLGATAPSASRKLAKLANGYSSLAPLFGDAGKIKLGEVEVARVVSDGKYFINPQFEWTGGGLITTAEDLARWAVALYGGDVLTEAARIAMLNGKPSPELGDSYGLGVQIANDDRWGPVYGHDGVMPGYITAVRYFPDYRVALAIQLNTDAPALLGHRPTWFLTELANEVLPRLQPASATAHTRHRARTLDPDSSPVAK